MKMFSSNPFMMQHEGNTLLFWYIVFGALHEFSHCLCAIWMGHTLVAHGEYGPFLFRLLLGRHTILSLSDTDSISVENVNLIRHTGWLFSVFVAIIVVTIFQRNSNAKMAAIVTALESITSDLFRWNVLQGLYTPFDNISPSSSCVLFCGNFGIIILHHAWFEKRGMSILDVLEKMVNITMMRGAQSGGVITFKPDSKNNLRGIRSRCVNSKRTDLSKLIRSKVHHDVFPTMGGKPFPKDFVPVFSGHTRFATSSIAAMDGTHPHQWTPPSVRRLYKCTVSPNGNHQYNLSPVKVENYITVSSIIMINLHLDQKVDLLCFQNLSHLKKAQW
jgi:hypothetical protein